jgi:hypothetical protein
MLIVNPEERVTITDVVKYCEQQILIVEKRVVKNNSALTTQSSDNVAPSKKKILIDPCLIMDDIAEKLVLLDYGKKFCQSRGHKQVS